MSRGHLVPEICEDHIVECLKAGINEGQCGPFRMGPPSGGEKGRAGQRKQTIQSTCQVPSLRCPMKSTTRVRGHLHLDSNPGHSNSTACVLKCWPLAAP